MLERINIPDPISTSGWKELPMEECGKPLVSLWGLHPRIQITLFS